MNVLLISQCNKRALTETRRILDQFAERRGDRTWQTPITWDGLTTLRKLLKKTARKNTAVACHWIRGKDHSELMWIVGNASQFNAEGAVPTNTTGRNILRNEDENSWHTMDALSLMAGIAGLFHDFGKANILFQDKLNPRKKTPKSEPLRHEWISLRLFMAFVGDLNDEQWLDKLHKASPDMETDLLVKLVKDIGTRPKNPFRGWKERPLALSLAWLIVSHHRLPVFPGERAGNSPPMTEMSEWLTYDFNAGWNSPQLYNEEWQSADWKKLWTFPVGTPLQSHTWCKKAQSLGKKALQAYNLKNFIGLDDLFTSHLARMVLMLADHSYSASEPTIQWQDKRYKAFANTDRETRTLKQKLDEHNIGVGHHAYLLAKKLPQIKQQLPCITRLKTLKKRATIDRFRWQDKAWDLARSLAHQTESQGFFGVNLASTGCGKTFANARIIYGLSNERQGCRFNVALGLRTMTLQTGDALAEKLGLGSEDLAVMIGSQAVKDLYQQGKSPDEVVDDQFSFSQAGSESAQALLDEELHVRYEGSLDDSYLGGWLKRTPQLHQLVSAPVLVSTIDYLIPATEGSRGGRQIAPMLRLMTSDLVLDEPDDFDLNDLPALCRLVHWAGLLGSRVLLSSATLPPSLVEALFNAYQAGRHQFNQARGSALQSEQVMCAWFDEFGVASHSVTNTQDFAQQHHTFVSTRVQKLCDEMRKKVPLRRGELLSVNAESKEAPAVAEAMAQTFHTALVNLHKQHCQDGKGEAAGKKISFGIIRMANIKSLVAVARHLLSLPLPEDHHLHFCVYHSQYPLLMRSRIEAVLDRALNRNDEELLWQQSEMVNLLKGAEETQHIFVVFGSPVIEVGRDLDFDWAIAEPSSMRSLIQLAGRVQRHRQNSPESSNILILDKNFKALEGQPLAYRHPGFESDKFPLKTHSLASALTPEQYQYISAIPRLLPRKNLDPEHNLVDLEHAHLDARLFGAGKIEDYAAHWWQHQPSWCYELQRHTPFRKSTPDELLMLYQEDEQDGLRFLQWLDDGELISQNHRFARSELPLADRVSPWINTEPEELISVLAEQLDEPVDRICKRFMQIRLRADECWSYHPLLGVYMPLKAD